MAAKRSESITDVDEATHEGVTPVSPENPEAKAFLDEFGNQMGARELRHYQAHQDKVRQEFVEKHLPTLLDSTARERAELAAAERLRQSAHQTRRKYILLAATPAATLAVAAVLIALDNIVGDFRNENFVLRWPAWHSDLRISQRVWVGVSLFGAILLGASCARLYWAAWDQYFTASDQYYRVKNQYDATVRVSVGEALRLSINDVLRGTGALLFPTDAPSLVELTSHKIVPSSTQDYVKEFIASHQSSAIGIAGTRGSGKSTLMNALRDDADLAKWSVVRSAPVQYDSVDFTRRLFLDCAEKVLGKGDHAASQAVGSLGRDPLARIYRVRIRGAFLAIVVGGLVLYFDYYTRYMSYAMELAPPRDVSPNPLAFLGPLGLAGGLAMLYGAVVLYWTTVSRVVRRKPQTARPSIMAAEEAERTLTWDVEQGQRSKNSLRLAGRLVGLEDEDSLKMKRRTLSHPDLVSGFRDLLVQVSRESPDEADRVLICVDELDKIGDAEASIAAVNGLKDLFHVPGVHFVVSVSTDALASFERRGVPTRDAFDSSFDTIVNIERLTVEESLDVVSSRAAGFPSMLSLFCHAWSGGLPRDLLRAARRCVEVQRRRQDEAVPAIDIVREVVLSDLRAYLTSAIDTIDRRSSDAPALAQFLCEIDQTRSKPEATKLILMRIRKRSMSGEVLEEARAHVTLGLALVEFFSNVLQSQSDWDAPSGFLVSAASEFARAVEAQGQLPILRDAAVARALAALGASSAMSS